jgi:long-chain acyl-CoA synthetase
MSVNLATVLRESARTAPHRPLLHFGDRTFTYAQVDEASGRVAAGLLDLGLRPGQRVGVRLPAGPQLLVAFFGILTAGLVVVPLDPSPAAEADAPDSDVGLLITPDTVGELERSADTARIAEVAGDDPAVVLGGAARSHSELQVASAAGTVRYRADDVLLSVLPPSHRRCLPTLVAAVRAGGTIVLVPRFDVAAVLEAIERHRCTLLCGVPAAYAALAQADMGRRDVSTLRVGVCAGPALGAGVVRAVEERFPGVVVVQADSRSETAALTVG